jgi:bifunctional UDP-N-acetylglucosamine pyrophosphorylase/glucosamine-1-phosphate N-acetyltransferase
MNNNLIYNNFKKNDFDWKFYVNYYKDLKDNGINTEESALKHWKENGQSEGRIINEHQCEKLESFDWKYYISKYPDLLNNGITNKISAYNHWIENGKKELRFNNKETEILYKTFDWKFYLNAYIDLRNSNIKTRADAFKHWIEKGRNEKRYVKKHCNFDWKYYIDYYDLYKKNKLETYEDAMEHYLNNQEYYTFINKYIEDDYKIFDWEKYISYYDIKIKSKDEAYNYWLITGKYMGHIFFKVDESNDELNNQNLISRCGIAVSVFSNNNTPLSRILCSKICLNSMVQYFKNSIIIIVIDGSIEDEHLRFVEELEKNNSNVELYMNNINYGISKTKNICIKLLEEYDIDYICLLDDDIEIIKDFSDYIEDIFKKVPDIPLLSNYNPYLTYNINNKYLVKFIETSHYFGNLLIINMRFIDTYGYMAEFEYKWGDEHVEFTNRYLYKTPYKNFALNFDNYIINEQIINGKNTLHMHSIDIDSIGIKKNHNLMNKLLEDIKYIDFKFDRNDIKKIYSIKKSIKKNNFILYKKEKEMEKLVVTIMAAGEGKRMKSNIPKVLHLFKNAPMLVRIIYEVAILKPHKIIIVTGKYDKLIKETLEDNLNSFIYKKLIFVKQEIADGTGGAIKSTLNKYSDDEKVLILNGDMPLIKSLLLKSIIEDKINSLVVTDLENPTGYGRILYTNDLDPSNLDNNNIKKKFIGIREEKDCSNEERLIKTVNVGIYYFEAGLLKKYIPMIDNNNIQNEYYLTDIVKVIYNDANDNIELYTYLINSEDNYQVLGVNTKEELEELEEKY